MPATTVVGIGGGVSGRFFGAGRDEAPDAGFAGVRGRGVGAVLAARAGLAAPERDALAGDVAAFCAFTGVRRAAGVLRAVAGAVLRALEDADFAARVVVNARVVAFFAAAGFFRAVDALERAAFFAADLRTAAFPATFLATLFFATTDFFATVFFGVFRAAAVTRFFATFALFFAADFFAVAVFVAGRLVAARLLAADAVLRTGVFAMGVVLP